MLGLDCSERLGSAPAEMGAPLSPQCGSCILGQGFLIPHTCHLSPAALLPPCQWVLFVSWFKILVTGAFTTWALERKQMWWVVLPCETTSKDSSTKWGVKEQSLTPLTTKAVFAAPLSFASRKKISKCYTENRSWNKLIGTQILGKQE